ncbi:MAG: hypothetical protein AAGC63_01890 [Propionicimonas sp.]|nr:hypothetical protein [Propionicimonas sp.]
MDAADRARARAAESHDTAALAGAPIRVRDAAGSQVAWFVPLVAGEALAGFVELLPDLTHRRTSWFGSPPGSPHGCPPAAWWTDPEVVSQRAAATLRPDETAGTPYLSFDTAPDRLAWAVPVDGPGGPRTIFVAGEAVWSGPAVSGPG